MAIDLSSLSPITTSALSLSNLVLVTPERVQGYQPQNPPKPNGSPSTEPKPPTLLFHYEGENSVTLESDITDHYVEDNTAVADHIALKPEIVTAVGFIGELNNVPPKALEILRDAASRLDVINAYAPQISTTAALAYAQAFFLYQSAANIANTAVSAWDTISNIATGGVADTVINSDGLIEGTSQNLQQKMFQQFYGYWKNRTLFTVQTPWAVFQNMAILRVKASQDAETKMISEFEVTFKMIRTARTIKTGGNLDKALDGRASAQDSSLKDLGSSSPTKSISFFEGISGMGVA